jgi:hypothetical protein
MGHKRWRKIEELFHAARECEEPQRTAFLAEACAGDDDLRHIVERLLARHHEAGEFLESPALADPGLVSAPVPGGTAQPVHSGSWPSGTSETAPVTTCRAPAPF